METHDARSLPAKAQEALRLRVVKAVRKGMAQTEAARVFGLARGTINGWVSRANRHGLRTLRARRRGRPPRSRLAPHQAATAVRMILGGCPDQMSLPFALWTREAVQQLLSGKFGVDGGTLFASVGIDAAKTGTASLRTESSSGAEMAGGR